MMRPIAGLFLAAAMLSLSGGGAFAATKCEDDEPTSQNNWTDSQRTAQPDSRFKRKEVAYQTAEAPGTIIIETHKTFLYLVLGNGKALRYGIGVGREGFKWTGAERITRKAAWPDWHPPKDMLKRDPCLPDMIPGGSDNPLGARALYLGNTEFRIHGTLYPATIGHSVSSGCIRLTNDDVIDLYNRVKIGTKVIVN
jgi:lipoprotein-anchoring transpeptidase ErfK/SrfK